MTPQADTETLVELRRAEKSYRMGKVTVAALKPTTLSIKHGEFLLILGPSGSGKTTLLNLIGGMDTPTAGSILFAGKDLAGMTEDELTDFRRHRVGFIFQFFNLIPTLTALENVQLVAELVENPLDAMQVLEAVGLAERANHFPSELAGGEQQRVAIARALVKRPKLLLADEPTGNLDVETGVQVLTVLTELTRAEGITVLTVTHNSVMAAIADRVVRMRSGEIVASEANPTPQSPGELVW